MREGDVERERERERERVREGDEEREGEGEGLIQCIVLYAVRIVSSIRCYSQTGCDAGMLPGNFGNSRECCVDSEKGVAFDSSGESERCSACEGIIYALVLHAWLVDRALALKAGDYVLKCHLKLFEKSLVR